MWVNLSRCLLSLKTRDRAASSCSRPDFNSSLPSSPGPSSSCNPGLSSCSNQSSKILFHHSPSQTDFSSRNNNLHSSFNQVFSSSGKVLLSLNSKLLSSALPLSQSSLPPRSSSPLSSSSSKACSLRYDLQLRLGRGSVEVRLLQNLPQELLQLSSLQLLLLLHLLQPLPFLRLQNQPQQRHQPQHREQQQLPKVNKK